MYRVRRSERSRMTSVEVYEGERIEEKIERIVSNKEAIKDGAPEIFTSRADGVIAAYNIRTDRWEVAAEAMDSVSASLQAKREHKAKLGGDDTIDKLVDGDKGEASEAGSTGGESTAK